MGISNNQRYRISYPSWFCKFKRDNTELPKETFVDNNGNYTLNPYEATGVVSFGEHKGYGLGLVNELFAGYIGCGTPTQRGKTSDGTSCFYFQVIDPKMLSNSEDNNVSEIIKDILDGNGTAILPGQIEYENRLKFEKDGKLQFSDDEIKKIRELVN